MEETMMDTDLSVSKEELYKRAVEILEEEGEDASYYKDYSGRGMYGRTTPGITYYCSDSLIGWAICVAGEEAGIGAYDMKDYMPTRTDNMGKGTIIY